MTRKRDQKQWPRRSDWHPATGGKQRLSQGRRQIAPLIVGEEAAEPQLGATRDHAEYRAAIRPFTQVHPRPVGVAVVLLPPPRGVHPRQDETGRAELQGLVAAAGTVVEPE